MRPRVGVRVMLAWLVMVAALVFAGHDLASDPAFMASARACLTVGTLTALVPALLCLVMLRRAVDVGGWRSASSSVARPVRSARSCSQLHCANTHLMHVSRWRTAAPRSLPIAIFALVTRR